MFHSCVILGIFFSFLPIKPLFSHNNISGFDELHRVITSTICLWFILFYTTTSIKIPSGLVSKFVSHLLAFSPANSQWLAPTTLYESKRYYSFIFSITDILMLSRRRRCYEDNGRRWGRQTCSFCFTTS